MLRQCISAHFTAQVKPKRFMYRHLTYTLLKALFLRFVTATFSTYADCRLVVHLSHKHCLKPIIMNINKKNLSPRWPTHYCDLPAISRLRPSIQRRNTHWTRLDKCQGPGRWSRGCLLYTSPSPRD